MRMCSQVHNIRLSTQKKNEKNYVSSSIEENNTISMVVIELLKADKLYCADLFDSKSGTKKH